MSSANKIEKIEELMKDTERILESIEEMKIKSLEVISELDDALENALDSKCEIDQELWNRYIRLHCAVVNMFGLSKIPAGSFDMLDNEDM